MKPAQQIESVASAHRERTARGEILTHPVWSDLGPQARREAYGLTIMSRRIEAALHPGGLSTTALAVLGRIGRRP